MDQLFSAQITVYSIHQENQCGVANVKTRSTMSSSEVKDTMICRTYIKVEMRLGLCIDQIFTQVLGV